MPTELEQNFELLERRITAMRKEYRRMKDELAGLAAEHEALKTKYDDERRANQELAEQQKNIKMHAALTGNPEHNRLMKNHINRLVKEVDACIAQLQNSGL